MLMQQSKFRGSWKKAWFVLDGAFLYKYKNDKPAKSFFVSFVAPERAAAEALAEEAAAQYITKLEEKACSLRINVYTPNKILTLTAPSEDTLTEWVSALQQSVATSCGAESFEDASSDVLRHKKEACEKLLPFMMAQTFAEVDGYQTLVKNLIDAGFLADDDPRHSDDIAKSGKMKLLKQSVDGNEWQKYYWVMVNEYIYYYKSRKKKASYDDDDDEDDDEDTNEMPWKGAINIRLATVQRTPHECDSGLSSRHVHTRSPLAQPTHHRWVLHRPPSHQRPRCSKSKRPCAHLSSRQGTRLMQR
jgi:hypothetical protein